MHQGLLITGLTLTGFGLLLAFVDLFLVQRSLRKYLQRPQTIQVGTSLKAIWNVLAPTVVGGKEPTLEDRVGRIEERSSELQRNIDKTNKQISTLVEEAVQSINRQRAKEQKALEKLFGEMWRIGLGVAAIVLFLLGVGFSIWGVVVSAARE